MIFSKIPRENLENESTVVYPYQIGPNELCSVLSELKVYIWAILNSVTCVMRQTSPHFIMRFDQFLFISKKISFTVSDSNPFLHCKVHVDLPCHTLGTMEPKNTGTLT